MSKYVAFLGSTDTVKGFIPLGIHAYPVEDQIEARTIFQKCIEQDFAILFVTEEVASFLEAELRSIRFNSTPAVLVVPSMLGSRGLGLSRLRTLVEKAVGADILSREESVSQNEDARTGV